MSEPLICYFALFSRSLEPIVIRNFLVSHLRRTSDLPILNLESLEMQIALEVLQLFQPQPNLEEGRNSTQSLESSLKHLTWQPCAQITINALLLDVYVREGVNGLKAVAMCYQTRQGVRIASMLSAIQYKFQQTVESCVLHYAKMALNPFYELAQEFSDSDSESSELTEEADCDFSLA
jgi:hypothetical protein